MSSPPADRATKLCAGCGIILDRDAAACPRCLTVQPDAPPGVVPPPPEIGSAHRRSAPPRSRAPYDVSAGYGAVDPYRPLPAGGTPGAGHVRGGSDKRILPAFLLCFLLGVFGAHRFYVGKPLTAILMICTLGGFGVWMLVDMVMLVVGAFTDGRGERITEWT